MLKFQIPMADNRDALGRTPEQSQRDADVGREAAEIILSQLDGIPVGVAYNVIGNLAVAVFRAVPYLDPADALAEYDEWAAYTRSIIESEVKERVQ
ncbi:hypothetical protein QA640_08900 [Bradyrhizobium sp. CB82]|uniref:hypothetical protein n=1 Tax=Bradyrhizobium sp. CB82 TaxID=3039159 RepID=UPI0024B10A72|nr:hypothetical protein [Bradyrhizobium sp. CB82]WFU42562.1 hypothetical protein QA640_08900 [Bradyrhizobium sp. CB82]